jgi:hypothetical protein
MNKYYIVDTTQRKEPYIFENVQGLVKHLEGTVQRKFGQTRAVYMQNLIDLGHGYDDRDGKNFTESMRSIFNIGIVSKDGILKNCNVHDVSHYSKYRTEMGD